MTMRHVGGITPEDYWDFQPGEPVMTIDGFPGKVTMVEDGPIAGTENYVVELDHGLGGGNYTSSMLSKVTASREAAGIHLAAEDYPELGDILDERPDPGKLTFAAAKVVPNEERAAADAEDHDEEDPEAIDPSLPGDSADQPSSCSYCGSTEFKDHTDNGRVRQATCGICNGTMSAHPGMQWTPELIGDPSNHPSMAIDPRSGASPAGGQTGMNDFVNFDTKLAAVDGPDWCTWRRTARCTFPGDRHQFALAIPQDRGPCPWDTNWQQQVCPISEPGPMALMQHKGALEAGPCPSCKGRGWHEETDLRADATDEDDPNAYETTRHACDDCDGSGHVGAMSDEELADGARKAEESRQNRIIEHVQRQHGGDMHAEPVFENVRSCPPWCPVGSRYKPRHGSLNLTSLAIEGVAKLPEGVVSEEPPTEKIQEAMRRLATQMRTANDSYQVTHRPPGPDTTGAPLHDLNDVHGTYGGSPFGTNSDVYSHPQHWTGFHDHELDRAVRSAEGKPHMMVTVYRAQPREHHSIRTGDWVTPSESYARIHADEGHDKPMHIVKATVPAQHIWTNADDIVEAGYHGPHIENALHHADVED